MKLTGRLLLEKLRGCLHITAQSGWEQCPPLGRPLFYEAGEPAQSGRLYLSARPDGALCAAGVCCLYTDGAKPAAPGGISLCAEETMLAVFNALQRLYDEYEQWQSQMEQIVLERGTVQRLLQVSYPVLGNPMLVIGADFSLTAQVGENQIPADLRLFDRDLDSIEVLNALKQDELYNQPHAAGVPFLFPAHIMGWRSWNVDLQRDNQTVNRLILVEQQRLLTEGDAELLCRMVPYVTYLLEQAWSALQPTNSLRALFHRILSDRTADYVEMSRQLSTLKWEPENAYLCLVLKDSYHDQPSYGINMICNHLERQYCCCSLPYQDDIVTFFNLTKESRSLDALSGEMKYFIRESYLKAGYSRIVTGHSNLRRQYLQASAALSVGSRLKPSLWIHQFNTFAFPYLLEQATRQMPANMICHEKLLLLRQHDEQQKTQYMQTLRIYLDTQLNAVQTAKQLYIHRSTLLYRLDRIRELLESKLDDPEELLYLAISFRLLEREQ